MEKMGEKIGALFIFIYVYINMHVHAHAHAHAHIHTHTHTPPPHTHTPGVPTQTDEVSKVAQVENLKSQLATKYTVHND